MSIVAPLELIISCAGAKMVLRWCTTHSYLHLCRFRNIVTVR